ncbi:MAG: WcaI family glycosyltransferase [Cytophagaceae bacterium]
MLEKSSEIRKLKLLVYGINYSPELIGIGKYTGEMCQWLAARGHEVEVITAMPYYPEWKTHDKYRGRFHFTEIIEGVKVHRCPIYVPKNVKGSTRVLHDFSFMISSAWFWLGSLFKSYDAVITIYPPLVSGLFPSLYKLIRRKPMIFHIQDLQVDAARELNIIRSKFFLAILEKTEKLWIRQASYVSSISEGMKERILRKGVPAEKYLDIPNWVDTDKIKPQAKDMKYLQELGFSKTDKIVLYSGSIGEKQGLEMILEVAEALKERKDVFFVLAGEGMMKEKLQKDALKKGLSNMKFLPLQPYEKLSRFLSIADLHLVLQKKAASDLVMPSKLTGILAAGGIAIVTAEMNSKLYGLLNKHDAAVLIEPESSNALEEAIRRNLDSKPDEIGQNARTYAETNLSINSSLLPLEEILRKTF